MKTAPNVINQESLTADKEWSPSMASSKHLPTTKNQHFTKCYTDFEHILRTTDAVYSAHKAWKCDFE